MQENKEPTISVSLSWEDTTIQRYNGSFHRGVEKWGIDNCYPFFLQDLMASATHFSILKTKVNLTEGDGFIYESQSRILTELIVKNILNRTAWDYWMYGGFALKLHFSRDGKQINHVDHIDFSKLRVDCDNQVCYYKKDWLKYTCELLQYPIFNGFIDAKQFPEQILYFSTYTPGQHCYPRPDYFGAIDYILIDNKLGTYHLSNVTKGFFPSVIISLPNMPSTPEAKAELKKNFMNFYQGENNAGNVFFLANDGLGDRKVEVMTFDASKNVDLFNSLNEITQQKIISAHGLTSRLLAGFETPGSLGNNNELVNASELFYSTKIVPSQNDIIKQIQLLLFYNGDSTDISIAKNNPIQFTFSEAALLQILTEDELRALAGYEPKIKPII